MESQLSLLLRRFQLLQERPRSPVPETRPTKNAARAAGPTCTGAPGTSQIRRATTPSRASTAVTMESSAMAPVVVNLL
jgi:hypothetical protein